MGEKNSSELIEDALTMAALHNAGTSRAYCYTLIRVSNTLRARISSN